MAVSGSQVRTGMNIRNIPDRTGMNTSSRPVRTSDTARRAARTQPQNNIKKSTAKKPAPAAQKPRAGSQQSVKSVKSIKSINSVNSVNSVKSIKSIKNDNKIKSIKRTAPINSKRQTQKQETRAENLPVRKKRGTLTPDGPGIPGQGILKQGFRDRNRVIIDVGEGAAAQKPKVKFIEFVGRQKFDYSFFLIVLILLAFGLVMLFSATYATANIKWGDNYYYIKRQLIFTAIGLGAMFFMSVVDYHFILQKLILRSAVVVSAGLMIMVRLVGKTVFGAERWISIGGITIQPSEILKLVTVMVIAEYMERNYDKLKLFWQGFAPLVIRVGVACLLVVIQPHISATIIILVMSVFMLFIGGAKWWHMIVLLAGIALAGVIAYQIFEAKGYDYIQTRLLSFRDPEADIKNKTYQTYQSLVTIGSGGFLGQGLGNSRQKYSFLPVTENDFIFSVIVEELGFVGAMLVLVLFVILVARGFYIAAAAPDKSGMLLCAGIVCQIGIQALLNIAVAINAIPNTGVSLPFLSYGGTALIMQLAEMGIVLNISRKAALS